MYTTHGLMTPADHADHQALTDTGPHPDCPGHHDIGDPSRDTIAYCSVADDCPGEEWEEVQAYDLQVPAPDGGPVPMGTAWRLVVYANTNRTLRLTPRQRRRAVKKAGRDPDVMVARDDGMGYPPNMQGYREIASDARPVSGAPV
jgi:hypothetical protein